MGILVIEDDRKMARIIAQGLQEAGFAVACAYDGESGLTTATATKPDGIVLDIMLPGLDGWQVLRSLRRVSMIPVLLLTARDSVEDKVKGLQAGADDYLIKPFALAEFLARVHCILRRGRAANAIVLKVADLELDTMQRCAIRSGKHVELTGQEFALLNLLMRHRGQPLSRAMIARDVWGIDFRTDTNIVEVAVRRLRAKMDDVEEDRLIHTVRGVGYIMEERGNFRGTVNAENLFQYHAREPGLA